MPSVDVRIIGGKDLEKKLHKLALAAQTKIVKKAMRESAKKTVLRKAIEYAPIKSGKLKSGIVIRALNRKKSLIGVSVETKKRDHFNIKDGDKYFYPALVEFGSKHQPAQSYLRRAATAQKKVFINLFQRLLASSINFEAKK